MTSIRAGHVAVFNKQQNNLFLKESMKCLTGFSASGEMEYNNHDTRYLIVRGAPRGGMLLTFQTVYTPKNRIGFFFNTPSSGEMGKNSEEIQIESLGYAALGTLTLKTKIDDPSIVILSYQGSKQAQPVDFATVSLTDEPVTFPYP